MPQLSSTGAIIKAAYEGQPDTNGLSDALADIISAHVILSPTDGVANHALLQARLTAGRPSYIARGIWPCADTLYYPSNSAIRGWGAMSIIMWPSGVDCMLPADSVDGAVMCHFQDFTIHGGWSPVWGTDPSTATQIGLHCLSDIDSTAINTANSLAGFGDNYGRVHNVHFTNIAGRGIVIEGRGEIIVSNCNFVRCLWRGIDCMAFDMWFTNNSVSVCGQECMWVGRASGATGEQSGAAGNTRNVGNKFWFNGMSTYQRPVACVMLDSPAHSVSNWYCNDIQDTNGTALHLNGDGIVFHGSIDAPFRLNEWLGFGIAPNLTEPVVNVDDVRDSMLFITMKDRLHGSGVRADLNQRPLAFGGGAVSNHCTLNLVTTTGETSWWNPDAIVTPNGNVNENIVVGRMGNIYHSVS